MLKSVVKGLGISLPKNILTNIDLEHMVDTTDEWIQQRTGITQRYIASEGETTLSLAAAAAKEALEMAQLQPSDIDLIIVATTTADHIFPAVAVEVQQALGITKGFAFDIQAVCSGFIYAITTADMYLRNGMARKALVIGSETFSRLLNWNDRNTCVLFGDGAGAVVLEAEDNKNSDNDSGIIISRLRSDGAHVDKLYVDGGVSTTQTVGHVRMQGREVFKHAVGMITDVIYDCFAATEYELSDLDWFIPHQANKRIIEASAKKLNIEMDKVVMTVQKYGNTSAASIPMAWYEGVKSGKVKKGDLILLEAMGGGFTWGAVLLKM
ncbi:beta-ketoacyl-ACP synthase III [Bartonella sp. DGB1]|uniref:beta-ketoacyl-ACP synthase III n=1 Tax=Bartonella sp. DGB1 TaxID=3239807 RepID=UPI00352622A4